MKLHNMKLHNMKEEELLQLANSNDTLPELKVLVRMELNRRESRRAFLRSTLAAWFAVIISLLSLSISVASFVSKKSDFDLETQTIPDKKRVSPVKVETTE